MAKQSGAGRLDRRYSFSRRVEQDDGHGNTVADFVMQFEVAGNRKYLRVRGGSETVMAARLSAHPLVILTIRDSIQSRTISADWIAEDTRTGEVFNIRETPQLSDSRAYLEMLCEAGVAV